MNITELIKELEKVRAEEGDLEVFDADFHAMLEPSVEDRENFVGGFPAEWNMPERWVRLGLQE